MHMSGSLLYVHVFLYVSVFGTLLVSRCPNSGGPLLNGNKTMQQVLSANRKSGMRRPTLWPKMDSFWLGACEFSKSHIETLKTLVWASHFSWKRLYLCQCSGVCGEGRMVRAVTCRSSGGVVMSEVQCDQLLRPLAIYPCGDRDCAPHWVEQEWHQVNSETISAVFNINQNPLPLFKLIMWCKLNISGMVSVASLSLCRLIVVMYFTSRALSQAHTPTTLHILENLDVYHIH